MRSNSTLALVAALALAPSAFAAEVVIDYEDLTEGAQGLPFTHQGVTYHDLNTVSGVFPDGATFTPEGGECIVEDAGVFYNDFPGYGSPVNALTFGIAFIPGDNLTIGPLSNVSIDLGGSASSASLDLATYEHGPWGGIVFHLDAVMGGSVVASDTFTLGDLGGRDEVTTTTLSVSAPDFDSLELYATYGEEYSLPRAMIDDLTIDYVDSTPVEETTWSAIKALHR